MLIVSPEFKCSNELPTIVAMLSVRLIAEERRAEANFVFGIVPNVWLRPNNQRKEADAAKQLLTIPDGDHLTMMNVYNSYVNSKSREHHHVRPLNNHRRIFQIKTTRTGAGTTISPSGRFNKPKTSGNSLSGRWSGSILISSVHKINENFI